MLELEEADLKISQPGEQMALVAAPKPSAPPTPASPPAAQQFSSAPRSNNRFKNKNKNRNGAPSFGGSGAPSGFGGFRPFLNPYIGMFQLWPMQPGQGLLGPRPGVPRQAMLTGAPLGFPAAGAPGGGAAASSSATNTWDPTALINTLNSMTLQQPDWIMDSGASSHFSNNQDDDTVFPGAPAPLPDVLSTPRQGAPVPPHGPAPSPSAPEPAPSLAPFSSPTAADAAASPSAPGSTSSPLHTTCGLISHDAAGAGSSASAPTDYSTKPPVSAVYSRRTDTLASTAPVDISMDISIVPPAAQTAPPIPLRSSRASAQAPIPATQRSSQAQKVVKISHYNLGNAYLTSFFVGGAWDHTKLHHSLKAYQNAADKYLENYERALQGFEAAALNDPGLDADIEVQKIISLLDKLENAMKVQLRSKRLASLVSSLSNVKCNSSVHHKY
ncbi:hypothetical protein PR202_gb29566 [Eleusine coracana subsp. coracana]|uniref:Uncharacterized protein n=1 Tax=Eleusine coracana subsp. coracana TaxID=191504 RepID=A0AAV5G0S4_ELECO|nr:hypothetical protein PR202_gb29566 [Eleusine coracana subsp. coracana]